MVVPRDVHKLRKTAFSFEMGKHPAFDVDIPQLYVDERAVMEFIENVARSTQVWTEPPNSEKIETKIVDIALEREYPLKKFELTVTWFPNTDQGEGGASLLEPIRNEDRTSVMYGATMGHYLVTLRVKTDMRQRIL